MSTFAVFGMTESHAKQLARRIQPKWLRKEQRLETEEEFEARVAEATEKHLDSQRMARVSPVFDAPPVLRSVHGSRTTCWS